MRNRCQYKLSNLSSSRNDENKPVTHRISALAVLLSVYVKLAWLY